MPQMEKNHGEIPHTSFGCVVFFHIKPAFTLMFLLCIWAAEVESSEVDGEEETHIEVTLAGKKKKPFMGKLVSFEDGTLVVKNGHGDDVRFMSRQIQSFRFVDPPKKGKVHAAVGKTDEDQIPIHSKREGDNQRSQSDFAGEPKIQDVGRKHPPIVEEVKQEWLTRAKRVLTKDEYEELIRLSNLPGEKNKKGFSRNLTGEEKDTLKRLRKKVLLPGGDKYAIIRRMSEEAKNFKETTNLEEEIESRKNTLINAQSQEAAGDALVKLGAAYIKKTDRPGLVPLLLRKDVMRMKDEQLRNSMLRHLHGIRGDRGGKHGDMDRDGKEHRDRGFGRRPIRDRMRDRRDRRLEERKETPDGN